MSVGVVFRPQQPPEELEAVVRAVDDAGVPELWLWEDCFLEGGLTTATAALAWSRRLRVGVGLLPVPLRNPALAAMEIATIARLFPDRFVPAVGHGVLDWMGQVGARVASPMTLLREHAVAVRDLLDGQRVDADGRYVHLDGVALDWPPATRPPLLVGARGDKTIRLAGEVADGVLLDSVTGPDVVRRGRALVDEGRESAGRAGRAAVTVYTEVDPTQPAATLARQVPERVAALHEAGADTVVLQATHEHPDPMPLVEALADVRPCLTSGDRDLVALDGDRHLVEGRSRRWVDRRAVLDRERAAVALAPDAAGLHRADDAALVGADGGEALELALGRLGDHHLLLREDQAAADGDVGGAGERAGAGRRRRVAGVEVAVVRGVGR